MFLSEIFQNLSRADEGICCKINGATFTYKKFAARVGAIQEQIKALPHSTIGITTMNAADTYAAIIACWFEGKAYVPLNPQYPYERLKLICSEASIEHVIITAEDCNFPYSDSLKVLNSWELNNSNPELKHFNLANTAYILFTSGTTGKPKGVPITFNNLNAFADSFNSLGYSLGCEDRFLQMFELTFDLSVMSFMIPLTYGASFHTLPDNMVKTLALYHILESDNITFSLMVPSAIQLLYPYLEEIELPQLRYSQFCGEALKTDLVSKWSHCIPNARIDNVYGPTEATIYCTFETLDLAKIDSQSHLGIVNIGLAMKNTEILVLDSNGHICDAGREGELCLAGAQVTSGYLNNPEQNRQSFIQIKDQKYYRTGDLVRMNPDGTLTYFGRLDDQVKIQGYRVELAEIELAAQQISPQSQNVAVAYQLPDASWQIALFILGKEGSEISVKSDLKKYLPDYMIPHTVLWIDEFPLNSNGKTDRKKLRSRVLGELNS